MSRNNRQRLNLTCHYNISTFRCRKTQAVYDKCVLDNLGIERPPYDYFVKTHIHKTERPRPPVEPPVVYKDTPEYLPPDYPRPEAKYGSRYFYMW